VVVVQASLDPIISLLKVACHAEDAVVRVDHEVVGGCPYEGDIAPGRHAIRIDAPGKKSYWGEFTTEIGENTVVSVKLESEAPTLPKPKGGDREKRPEPPKEHGSPALLASGIACIALGVGGAVVGVAFSVKGANDEEEGQSLYTKMETSAAEWDSNNDDYNELRKEDIPLDNGLAIAGYVTGGVLLVTGAILTGLSSRRKAERRDISFTPVIRGAVLNVRF
jgi:hypothetical protein